MTQAEKPVANRREYQRRWMAAKRKAVREARGVEKLTLVLPKALLADLRARKPYGLSLKQWVPAFLREKLRAEAEGEPRKPVVPSLKEQISKLPNVPRNAPCPCKSGRKFKACCGKPG